MGARLEGVAPALAQRQSAVEEVDCDPPEHWRLPLAQIFVAVVDELQGGTAWELGSYPAPATSVGRSGSLLSLQPYHATSSIEL